MLKAFGPDGDQIAVYETYRTDAKHPYVSGYNPDPDWVTFGTDSSSEESSGESSEKSSEQSQEDIADDKQNIPDETQGLSNSPEYVDDEGFVDTAEHRSSGITDIMVTGTVSLELNSRLLSMRFIVSVDAGLLGLTLGFPTRHVLNISEPSPPESTKSEY